MYELLYSVEHKRRYFKDVGDQTVDGTHWLPWYGLIILWKAMGTKTFQLPAFFKISLVTLYLKPLYTMHYKGLLKAIMHYTVFLSRFVAFLRLEIKFSKLFVQPHHLVTCAHHKSSFSFFWTSCDSFVTFMQLIMYICLRFPSLSVAIVMLLKMYYIVLCAIVLPLKTSSH